MLALTLNGKKRKLKRQDFEIAMKASGLEGKVISNIFKKFLKHEEGWIRYIDISFLHSDIKTAYKMLIHSRLQKLI